MNRQVIITAQVCAVLYGMVLAILQLELFTSAETSLVLVYWSLMPTLWILKQVAPGLLGSVSIYAIAGANALLLFLVLWGALKAKEKISKKEPNQPPEPIPLTRDGSS